MWDAVQECRMLCMDMGCSVGMQDAIQRHRMLCRDVGYYTRTLGAMQGCKMLCRDAGCCVWAQDATQECRMLCRDAGCYQCPLLPGSGPAGQTDAACRQAPLHGRCCQPAQRKRERSYPSTAPILDRAPLSQSTIHRRCSPSAPQHSEAEALLLPFQGQQNPFSVQCSEQRTAHGCLSH